MQLSEHKTYRTRDGSRTGLRVRRRASSYPGRGIIRDLPWIDGDGETYRDDGGWWATPNPSPQDLFEETPATPQPFSYDACPVHEDGRRRAVTRAGAKVVLLCKDAPGSMPIRGYYDEIDGGNIARRLDGRFSGKMDSSCDLLVPPLPKRVVWVNQYERKEDADAADRLLSANTDQPYPPRLGNRAYPIEID